MNHFTGAVGQQRVPDDFLRNLVLPLPSIIEQRRITDVLREGMAAVEKARVAAKERQAAAGALHIAYLREVFDTPEATEWKSKRLGDVLVPHKEIIHPGDREDGTAEFVGLEHLEPHTGRRFGSLTLDLTKLTGRKPTFRRGQIVYGYLRPYLNKVWIAEFDGCSSVDQFALAVRSDVADARFVAWFMRSPTFLRRSAIVTTTGQLPRIGTEEIAAVEIGLPPLSRQHAIADEIDRWVSDRQQLSDLLQAEGDAINGMPPALLRQAFAGEV
jgi:restriction endonuclease S subunit